MPGAVVFLADLLQSFHSCTVIVKKAVDALIASQWIECFGNIGYGIKNHVILPVEIGVLRTVFEPQGKKGKVVHKSLENETGVLRFLLPYVCNVFRSNTPLEISVAKFIQTFG